jgi:hypothetical protein
MPTSKEYTAIQAFHELMKSPEWYIKKQKELAVLENAPINSIYKSICHGWILAHQLNTTFTKRKLNKFLKPCDQIIFRTIKLRRNTMSKENKKSKKNHEDPETELARLRAEVEELKKKKGAGGSISFAVSKKGAVSVYGLGRFPVTLYKEQWLRLLKMTKELKEFIEEHNDELSVKENKKSKRDQDDDEDDE